MTLLIFLSTKSLYNFWHLEKFWASFDEVLYSENLWVVDFRGSPCRAEFLNNAVLELAVVKKVQNSSII